MVRLTRTRNGLVSADVNRRALYSRYDPASEAARYTARELESSTAHTVLLLGAGLGYLTAAVRDRLPAARIIAVHFAPELFARRICDADRHWCSNVSETPFAAFLESCIADEEIETLVVLQWEPCMRAFEHCAEPVVRSVADFLDRRSASLATERYFGKRWIYNSVSHALDVYAVQPPGAMRRPVLIAASGPSLAESLDLLRGRAAGLALWALSSAVPILLHAGHIPDLVIATDAGFYASHHLRPLAGYPSIPVAAPLSLCVSPSLRRRAVTVIDQGSWFEQDLITATGMPSLRLPPNGTVAGSAWSLAAALGASEAVFAGLDLCLFDIRSHPRGHAFDELLRCGESRCRPYHHLLFERNVADSQPLPQTPGVRTSRALRTYAAWFRGAAAAFPVPGTRLRPSPVDLGLAVRSCLPDCSRLPYAAAEPARPAVPAGMSGNSARRAAVAGCIANWRSQLGGLREALLTAPDERNQAQQRLVEMARTVDTAGFLQSVRSLRRRPRWSSEGEQLQQGIDRFFELLLRRTETRT